METILVVDDEVAICMLLQEFFSAKEYRVLTATTGEAALATIVSEDPQVVLLDLRMSGMSGLEVLQRVRRMEKNIRVIVVSAVQEEGMAREALRMGADGYVTKPFDLASLEITVLAKVALMAKCSVDAACASLNPPLER